MKLLPKMAYLLTPVFLGSTLIGCGQMNSSTTPAITPTPPAANVTPPSPPPPPPPTGVTRTMGSIEFAPGAVTASASNFIPDQDIDRYTFDASAGQPADVRIDSQTGQVLLTLIAPGGTPLMRSQSGSNQWSGTLPTDGTYTVDAVNTSGGTSYSVNLNIQPAGGGSSNTRNQGVIPFPPGSTTANVNGFLPESTTDRYTFNASAGRSANLNLNTGNAYMTVKLFDPDGNLLSQNQSGDRSWAGTLPESGSYEVDVVNPAGAGSYNLGVNLAPIYPPARPPAKPSTLIQPPPNTKIPAKL